jgi:hydrogenase maturation protease
MKTLIYAIGNPSRGDDAIGPYVCNKLQQMQLNADFYENYQLQVEDTTLLKDFDKVIFVDAAVNMEKDFELFPIEASDDSSFTTHSLSMESLLFMTQDLFNHKPSAWLLAIKGECFELGDDMTLRAKVYCNEAIQYFLQQTIL